MTCDLCKNEILPGQPYSISEHGRLHEVCRRAMHPGGRLVGVDDLGPIFGLETAAKSFAGFRTLAELRRWSENMCG